MLPVVWARASASIQMANYFLPPPEPWLRYGCYPNSSDYVICQYGAWPLGCLVSCYQLFFFCCYIAFVQRSTAIPAVRIPVCTLYSKLTCSYRNFEVSVIYILLIQQSTGIVIRGMTPALSLRCTSSWRLPNDSCTASLRICTLVHDQTKSVG